MKKLSSSVPIALAAAALNASCVVTFGPGSETISRRVKAPEKAIVVDLREENIPRGEVEDLIGDINIEVGTTMNSTCETQYDHCSQGVRPGFILEDYNNNLALPNIQNTREQCREDYWRCMINTGSSEGLSSINFR